MADEGPLTLEELERAKAKLKTVKDPQLRNFFEAVVMGAEVGQRVKKAKADLDLTAFREAIKDLFAAGELILEAAGPEVEVEED